MNLVKKFSVAVLVLMLAALLAIPAYAAGDSTDEVQTSRKWRARSAPR